MIQEKARPDGLEPGKAEQEMIGPGTMTSPTAAGNRALISEFEQGRAPAGFHHADHVRMAFAYVSEFSLLEALARFSAALKRFALAQGKPNLYHETITWAYLLLIAERVQVEPRSSWEEFAARNADLLVWKGGVIERYYTKQALESNLARRMFVLPDRVIRERPRLQALTSKLQALSRH